MIWRRSVLLLAGLLVIGWLGTAVRADQGGCTLKRLATIPALLDRNRLLIAAGINGTPVILQLDTGASASVISEAVANRLGIATRYVARGAYGLGGGTIQSYAYLSQLRVGNAAATDTTVYVMPGGADGIGGRPVGYYGSDYLSRFDVDIDPAHGQVVLFDQDHCADAGVGWFDSAIKVPFSIPERGNAQIDLTVLLDGRPVRAELDTGSASTILRLTTASRRFGLSPDAPGMEAAAATSGVEGTPILTYRHSFDSLTLGAITLTHPTVEILPITFAKRYHPVDSHLNLIDDAMPDLFIGMDILQHLHMFIAYSENMLYFTVDDGAEAKTN